MNSFGSNLFFGKDDAKIKLKCTQSIFKHMKCMYKEKVENFTGLLAFM